MKLCKKTQVYDHQIRKNSVCIAICFLTFLEHWESTLLYVHNKQNIETCANTYTYTYEEKERERERKSKFAPVYRVSLCRLVKYRFYFCMVPNIIVGQDELHR